MKQKAIGGAGDARMIGRYIVHNILDVTYLTGKGKKKDKSAALWLYCSGEIRGLSVVHGELNRRYSV